MRIFFAALISAVVIFMVGTGVGWYVTKIKTDDHAVSSQNILAALRERGFLVTETSVSNAIATIKNDETSVWKRFLWGQEIKASGVVEVNMGVDLSQTQFEDVKFEDGKVVVTIPKAEIFNSRLVGDINVTNKQGILKRLLASDDGYNQAMAELIRLSEESVSSTGIIDAANNKAREEIKRLIGYMVPDKQVEVETKE